MNPTNYICAEKDSDQPSQPCFVGFVVLRLILFLCFTFLGIVAFQVAYTVTFEEKTTTYPFVYVDDIHAESFSFDLDIKDGMKIDVQVRATDVFGVFVDDYTRVKVDTSAPIIEDFMLVRGDILKVAVHNVDDLTQLQ